jgi:predicted RNA-binding protein with PUA-like domain
MNWLFKEEPSNFSFDSLVKEKKTVWSGVRNPLAQKHLHAVKKGDRIFYYHTGGEKAVVGIAKALGNSYPDPTDTTGKWAAVDVAPVTNNVALTVNLSQTVGREGGNDFYGTGGFKVSF